jgi:hypothetical protein
VPGQRNARALIIKVVYCFHQNNECSKCEVAHTSLLIGRATLLIGRSTAYAVVRRSSKNCPAHAGLFYAARIILYPVSVGRETRHNGAAGYGASMQKAPSRITGPFGRSSIGGECSLTPTAFSIRHALIWFQKKCVRYISGRLRSQDLRIASLLPLLIAFMLPQALLLLVWLGLSSQRQKKAPGLAGLSK